MVEEGEIANPLSSDTKTRVAMGQEGEFSRRGKKALLLTQVASYKKNYRLSVGGEFFVLYSP